MMKKFVLIVPLLLLAACSYYARYKIAGGTVVMDADTMSWNVVVHNECGGLAFNVISNKDIYIATEGQKNTPKGSVVAQLSTLTLEFKSLGRKQTDQSSLVVSMPVEFSKIRKGFVRCDLTWTDGFRLLRSQSKKYKSFQVKIYPNSILTYNGEPLMKDTITMEGTIGKLHGFRLSSDLEISWEEFQKICNEAK